MVEAEFWFIRILKQLYYYNRSMCNQPIIYEYRIIECDYGDYYYSGYRILLFFVIHHDCFNIVHGVYIFYVIWTDMSKNKLFVIIIDIIILHPFFFDIF